ncbi:hypothetical protein CYD30_29080 [Kosakonia cowanii]|nr:hypothetical protein CYD30_29080 [Kosakonia cowanii]
MADAGLRERVTANLGLGSAATRDVGTGPGQIPDMSRFSSSLSPNSWEKGNCWQKLPSGLMLQWGRVKAEGASNERVYRVVLPLAYATVICNVIVTPFAGYCAHFDVYNISADTFDVSCTAFNPEDRGYPGFFWQTMGWLP